MRVDTVLVILLALRLVGATDTAEDAVIVEGARGNVDNELFVTGTALVLAADAMTTTGPLDAVTVFPAIVCMTVDRCEFVTIMPVFWQEHEY